MIGETENRLSRNDANPPIRDRFLESIANDFKEQSVTAIIGMSAIKRPDGVERRPSMGNFVMDVGKDISDGSVVSIGQFLVGPHAAIRRAHKTHRSCT